MESVTACPASVYEDRPSVVQLKGGEDVDPETASPGASLENGFMAVVISAPQAKAIEGLGRVVLELGEGERVASPFVDLLEELGFPKAALVLPDTEAPAKKGAQAAQNP